jgi:hypothetical protein
MKITANNYDISISIERPDDITISELLEMFRTIAIGVTFTPVQWDNGILDLADEIRDNLKENECCD